MTRAGHVYFIGGDADGPIKIGFSRDPAARLIALQSGSPEPLKILASFRTADPWNEEQALHARFQAIKLRGEWFTRSPELLFLIDLCLAGWRPTPAEPDTDVPAPPAPEPELESVESGEEPMTITEIAAVTGDSVDAIRQRRHRLRIPPRGRRGNALLYRLQDLS